MYVYGASLIAQLVKNLHVMQETWVRSLGWEDPLEKRTATHSSILAWRSLHTLAVINNATVNIGVHVSFRVCVCMYRPGNTVAGSYSSTVFSWFFFFFLRNLHIPQWLYQFTLPLQYMRICFPHILTICYLCSFWWQSFWPLGVIAYCGPG